MLEKTKNMQQISLKHQHYFLSDIPGVLQSFGFPDSYTRGNLVRVCPGVGTQALPWSLQQSRYLVVLG